MYERCGSRFFHVALKPETHITNWEQVRAFIILRDEYAFPRDVATTQNRDPILAKARRRSLFTGIIGHTA
jgi:hypothetical protein